MGAKEQIAAIELQFVKLLHELSGLPVINERNPGAQYPSSYISFRIVTAEGTQYPMSEYADVEEGSLVSYQETVSDNYYFSCLIRCIGKDAFYILTKLKLQLRGATRWADLFNSIGYGGIGDVQNVSSEFNGRIQEMAVVDFEFYAPISDTTAVDYFISGDVTVKEPIVGYEKQIIIEGD